ncbi:MAG: hypothetical protein ACI9TH_004442 [Kiritimatiellia bacterium]
MDARTVELQGNEPNHKPDWARLESNQCSHGPLSKEEHAYCPVALSLVNVTDAFKALRSFESVDIFIETSERRFVHSSSTQKVLSSLVGLLITTSGCPHTEVFKPMARFHLPVASEVETGYRAISMYLTAQFFLMQEGLEPDFELKNIEQMYQNIHEVNFRVAERLRFAKDLESVVNGISILDINAHVIPLHFEESISDIKSLFEPYLAQHRDGKSLPNAEVRKMPDIKPRKKPLAPTLPVSDSTQRVKSLLAQGLKQLLISRI